MNLITIPALGPDGTFNVVVESPRGSTLKLKYEPGWETMSVSRPLPAGLLFPFDWGFVPSTRGADHDPVDAFLMWDVPAFPGVVVACRPLGVLQVEQNAANFDPSARVRNDRVLAIPTESRREHHWTSFRDIGDRLREECVQFTLAAAALEGKDVKVLGWGEPAEAMELIAASRAG